MDKQYKIPSSIASKLEQIKLYMGMHSVTAFVGAGFSLNAELPNNVKMKTWKQHREAFLDKPYPNNEEDRLKDGNDVVGLNECIYKELLILFANLVVRDYTENDFNSKLVGLLDCIHQNYNRYDLDVTELSDLQHYSNFVAGVLSVKNPNLAIPVFDKEETGFNDVVVGFDKGIELANRKND